MPIDSKSPANHPMIKKVLIVEDDPIIANLVDMFLSKKGYLICGKVETGEHAIAKVAEEFPNLVLMDIGLKGALDGIFAAKYIFNVFNVPVVFLTGISDDETIQRASRAEPFGFITKPFADKDLYSNIEIALHNHAMRNRILKVGETPIRKVMSFLDAVLLTDTAGRIFFMNSYAEILLNVKALEVIPRRICDVIAFIDTRTGQHFEDPIRDIIRESLIVGMEKNIAIVTPDQKTKNVTLTARPLRDAADEIIGVVVMIHSKTQTEQRMARLTGGYKQCST
jgi:DNA-binding NarL/FixJ family response regulator